MGKKPDSGRSTIMQRGRDDKKYKLSNSIYKILYQSLTDVPFHPPARSGQNVKTFEILNLAVDHGKMHSTVRLRWRSRAQDCPGGARHRCPA